LVLPFFVVGAPAELPMPGFDGFAGSAWATNGVRTTAAARAIAPVESQILFTAVVMLAIP
jgi:hypothetical protein